MTLSQYLTERRLKLYFHESKRSIVGSILLSLGVFYLLYTVSIPVYIGLAWFLCLSGLSICLSASTPKSLNTASPNPIQTIYW